MAYTLGEAAKATGKSKAAIAESIAKGRISANKDDLGRYQIDPSELHRLYPALPPASHQTERGQTDENALKVRELQAKLDLMRELLDEVKGERDNLRDQNTRLTALLPPPRPTPVAAALEAVTAIKGEISPEVKPKKQGFWPWRKSA